MTEQRRTTLADQVVSSIVGLIEQRHLRPADEIPAEGELARLFGVNRLVVREAVRTLVAREVLDSRQGRPARVTVPSPRVLAQIVEFRLGQQTLGMEDLLDTRALIEVELAGRAAERVARGEADATVAARVLTRAIGQSMSREDFIDLDIAFHDAIASLSGAELLRLMLTSLQGVMRRARETTYDGRARRGRTHAGTTEHHRLVLEAVAAGDPTRARAAMHDHLTETRADLGQPDAPSR